jgi:hypothetical protein
MSKEKNEKLNIEDWGRKIYKYAGMPAMLAQIGVKMAGQYASTTQQYIRLKLLYAKFYDEWKHDDEGKKRSDKMIDNMWLLNEDGAKQYQLKRELRAYEHMMQACKTATFIANQEAKNQY